ncbi:MAG TPA: aminotransferase class IV [Spongiibacteraceae bacterium]|nr:aminotransferase class IV [Spongiibacteraceae bacterium]
MGTVYLNGEYLPVELAKVSVMDRGFLFGDGVYEVIPVFGGKLFRGDEHLRRLDYSLQETGIPQPLTDAQWHAVFERLITLTRGEGTGSGDQMLYLQITRGVAAQREHKFPQVCVPTVFVMSRELAAPPAEIPAPIACITVPDIRWQRCDVKSTSLLGSVLMTQQAIAAGAGEAILTRDGIVFEGAASNVFAVVDGVLHTAPKDHHILAGITRDLIVELAQQHGLALREEAVTIEQLRRASEVWISSSTRDMTPVATLDGERVGNGSAGPIFNQLWQWYRALRATLKSAE